MTELAGQVAIAKQLIAAQRVGRDQLLIAGVCGLGIGIGLAVIWCVLSGYSAEGM